MTVYPSTHVLSPKQWEIIEAFKHSWARQHDWQLLRFFPFPVGNPMSAGFRHLSTCIYFKRRHSR